MAKRAILDELDRMHQYPDNTSSALVTAIADFYAVDPRRVTVANGVDEIILLLVLALADENRSAVVTDATFASYRESLGVARQPLTTLALRDYRVPVDEIAAKLAAGAPFAFVCTPHNPTGAVLDEADLARLERAAVTGGGVLIVDEAYSEYAGADVASALPWAATGRHVCVMRTFSKAYGLAGLRVGYAIGDPDVIARVNRLHSAVPYHVNRVAQRAAVAALADQQFMRDSVSRTVETRELFRLGLRELGLPCPPSHANFVLVPLESDSTVMAAALRERGFAVRDTTDMGLPHHIRVSIGTPAQMSAVLDAVASLLSHR